MTTKWDSEDIESVAAYYGREGSYIGAPYVKPKPDRLRNRPLHVTLIIVQVCLLIYAVMQVYTFLSYPILGGALGYLLDPSVKKITVQMLGPMWALLLFLLSGVLSLAMVYPIDRTRPKD